MHRPILLFQAGARDGKRGGATVNSEGRCLKIVDTLRTTRTNFEEWLCLQNPGNSDAHTTISYYTTSGQVITKAWTVKANTRLTVSANVDVGANQDISTRVSSDKPIIVERPMYFDFNGWTGGHDVVGFVPSP